MAKPFIWKPIGAALSNCGISVRAFCTMPRLPYQNASDLTGGRTPRLPVSRGNLAIVLDY